MHSNINSTPAFSRFGKPEQQQNSKHLQKLAAARDLFDLAPSTLPSVQRLLVYPGGHSLSQPSAMDLKPSAFRLRPLAAPPKNRPDGLASMAILASSPTTHSASTRVRWEGGPGGSLSMVETNHIGVSEQKRACFVVLRSLDGRAVTAPVVGVAEVTASGPLALTLWQSHQVLVSGRTLKGNEESDIVMLAMEASKGPLSGAVQTIAANDGMLAWGTDKGVAVVTKVDLENEDDRKSPRGAEILLEYREHNATSVGSVAFLPRQRVAFGFMDGIVRIWRIDPASLETSRSSAQEVVPDICIRSEPCCITSLVGLDRVFTLPSVPPLPTTAGSKMLQPLLVSGAEDGCVFVWDLRQDQPASRLASVGNFTGDPIHSVAVHPRTHGPNEEIVEPLVAVGDDAGSVWIYAGPEAADHRALVSEPWRLLHKFDVGSPVVSCHFFVDGTLVVASCEHGVQEHSLESLVNPLAKEKPEWVGDSEEGSPRKLQGHSMAAGNSNVDYLESQYEDDNAQENPQQSDTVDTGRENHNEDGFLSDRSHEFNEDVEEEYSYIPTTVPVPVPKPFPLGADMNYNVDSEVEGEEVDDDGYLYEEDDNLHYASTKAHTRVNPQHDISLDQHHDDRVEQEEVEEETIASRGFDSDMPYIAPEAHAKPEYPSFSEETCYDGFIDEDIPPLPLSAYHEPSLHSTEKIKVALENLKLVNYEDIAIEKEGNAVPAADGSSSSSVLDTREHARVATQSLHVGKHERMYQDLAPLAETDLSLPLQPLYQVRRAKPQLSKTFQRKTIMQRQREEMEKHRVMRLERQLQEAELGMLDARTSTTTKSSKQSSRRSPKSPPLEGVDSDGESADIGHRDRNHADHSRSRWGDAATGDEYVYTTENIDEDDDAWLRSMTQRWARKEFYLTKSADGKVGFHHFHSLKR